MFTNSMTSVPPESAIPDITRLLLVDDDPLFLELCKWMLSRAGRGKYVVCTAADMQQAEELCRTEAFDCLLVDYRLPDGIGTQLIESLTLAMGSNSPASIVITAELEEIVTVSADRAGADCCITKENLSSKRLLSAIDAAVLRYETSSQGTKDHSEEREGQEANRLLMDVPLSAGQLNVSGNARNLISALSDSDETVSQPATIEKTLQVVLDEICFDMDTQEHASMLRAPRIFNQSYHNYLQVPVIRAIASVAPKAALKTVAINTRLDENCPILQAKADKLQEVLETLLHVLLDASVEQGKLLLSVQRLPLGGLEVSISTDRQTHGLFADEPDSLAGLFALSAQRMDSFRANTALLEASVNAECRIDGTIRIVLNLNLAAPNESEQLN